MTFFIINLSPRQTPVGRQGAVQDFRIPLYPLTPLPGVVSCALLLAYLNRYTLVFGAIWIAVGIFIFQMSMRKFRETEEARLRVEVHSEKRPEKEKQE